MATVTVNCGLAGGLALTLHRPIDFGNGVVQTRLINEPVVLKAGPNPGVDKAFFEAWQQQNANLSVMPFITAVDDPEPEQQPGAQSAAAAGAKPMDLDRMHQHVNDLQRWRARVDKVLSGFEAASGGPGSSDLAAINDRLDQLQHRAGDLEEAVTALQKAKDSATASSLGEQTSIRGDEAMLGGRVTAIEGRLAGIDEVLAWFGQNREALEVLLSLGDSSGGETAGPKDAGVTGALSSGPAASNVDVDQSGSTEFHPSSGAGAGPDLGTAAPQGSMVSGADLGTGISPAAEGPGGPDVANMADAAARGAAGAPAAEVGADAQVVDKGDPAASLTAAEVIKDPSADPSTTH